MHIIFFFRQVLIYSPTFFKYVFDTWLEGHGRYPSTGFLSLMLAVHICDEVSRAPDLTDDHLGERDLARPSPCAAAGLLTTCFCSPVCRRSACLDSARTSTETGTTTGRRTICPERSVTRASTTGITNTMSRCSWRTSTKLKCSEADDQTNLKNVSVFFCCF